MNSLEPVIGQCSYIGLANLTQNVNTKNDAKNSISAPCPHFKAFEKAHPKEAAFIRKEADHEEVVPTTANVDVRTLKSESLYTYPSDDDTCHNLAYKYASRHLSYIKSDVIQPGEPMTFKSSSAAGILGKVTGTAKTVNYLPSETFNKYKFDIQHIPIQIINFKDEFLSPEDLARTKIRFVDNVDKSFLFKQKYFFDKQNHKLVENHATSWIKYGFSKQYGGFNELTSSYEDCAVILFSDVSGYDIAAVLREVYQIRLGHMKLSDDPETRALQLRLLEYTIFYTLNPVRLYPNGQIFAFDKSNSSGQNNTAPDNSILHVIIAFDLIITLWFDMFGVYPTYDECINNTTVALYSDDKALGFKNHFVPEVSRLAQVETEVYAKYGMTIKKSASKIVTHIPGTLIKDGDFEFLGSSNQWSDEDCFYFPIPREKKLCTSLVKYLTCTRDVLDVTNQFQKIVQIESLLFRTPFYGPVKAYREFFIQNHPDLDVDAAIECVEGLTDIDSLDLRKTKSLFTGREGSTILKALL